MNNSTTAARCETSATKKSLPVSWSRFLVLKMLTGLQHGQIILQEGHKKWVFGKGGSLRAHILVNDKSFYRKVLLGGSIGGGEAYVDGIWKVDDLTALVRIMVLNMAFLDRMERGFAWLLRPVDLLRHALNANSKSRSKRNILAHYDLGNDMYASFLDPTMMYSSAIYPRADASLEEASAHKLEIICRKLDLQPTDRVIEIGTGWGGFAIYAAKNYGCHVTTTTISDAQYQEAAKRVRDAGLTDRITLLRSDYRDLTGQYDKLVSIEMIEAVGHRFLPVFFAQCGELLKPDGKMLLQAITITDQKYKQYTRTVDFIQRYIFPGGCLPSNSRMLQLIAEKTDMVVRQLDDFGFDYARTLRDWRSRFNESFAGLRNNGYDETFRRLWEYYLCYCEGGFLERSISVVQLVASRPGHRGR
ncbi:class I SAM-dependent methyltransferase [Desulfopila sp. IMCC35006]|uniref:SAM-dependent methyltransferase n=1 Tax=Desulfopila sp. IMCC35006 TaxID=2569542 RepID=UPI0010ABE45A|nr:cyclopropane-fatty-acyl-phospholipid synthase family protein [Desulfopila sp. IMCC35006]TKB24824.1 class I SAM-dependent methyltransferase [Desulfopila sp. IMCC35006]